MYYNTPPLIVCVAWLWISLTALAPPPLNILPRWSSVFTWVFTRLSSPSGRWLPISDHKSYLCTPCAWYLKDYQEKAACGPKQIPPASHGVTMVYAWRANRYKDFGQHPSMKDFVDFWWFFLAIWKWNKGISFFEGIFYSMGVPRGDIGIYPPSKFIR
jgi:hypothetical protein